MIQRTVRRCTFIPRFTSVMSRSTTIAFGIGVDMITFQSQLHNLFEFRRHRLQVREWAAVPRVSGRK